MFNGIRLDVYHITITTKKGNRDSKPPFPSRGRVTAGPVSCQAYGSSAWDRGIFGELPRPEALCFGAFWRRGLARAKAEGRLTGGAAHLGMEAKALLVDRAHGGR
jgi:hypothetical protein